MWNVKSSWYEPLITVLQRIISQLNFEWSPETSTDFSHIRFLHLRFSFQGNFHISYIITEEVSLLQEKKQALTISLPLFIFFVKRTSGIIKTKVTRACFNSSKCGPHISNLMITTTIVSWNVTPCS